MKRDSTSRLGIRRVGAVATASLLVVGGAALAAPAHAAVTEGVLSGKVTGNVTAGGQTNDQGLEGIQVLIFPWDDATNEGTGADTITATTGADGTYSQSLPDGQYRVCFVAPSDLNYVAQCAGDHQTAEDSTHYDFNGDNHTANADLAVGATISGTVTSATTGAGLGKIAVLAVDAGDGSDSATITGSAAVTASNGTYTVTQLPAGNFVVTFLDATASADPYRTGYYSTDGTLSGAAEATPVTVTAGGTSGGTKAGIDGALSLAPVFSDIAGDPFKTDIQWMSQFSITTGYPDGTFRPLGTVNRDAMAAFLYRAAGQPAFTPPTTPSFSDVQPSNLYYKQIEWAKSVNITTGYPDGTYRPLQPVTRDAMAAFLYRAAGSPDFTAPATPTFADVTPANDPYYKQIEWLAEEGITTGYPDHTYRPLSAIQRNAMAAFLYRSFTLNATSDSSPESVAKQAKQDILLGTAPNPAGLSK